MLYEKFEMIRDREVITTFSLNYYFEKNSQVNKNGFDKVSKITLLLLQLFNAYYFKYCI